MPEVQVISEQTKLENHASYQVQVGELTYDVALTRACDSWNGAWYWVAGIYRWEGIRQIPSHPGWCRVPTREAALAFSLARLRGETQHHTWLTATLEWLPGTWDDPEWWTEHNAEHRFWSRHRLIPPEADLPPGPGRYVVGISRWRRDRYRREIWLRPEHTLDGRLTLWLETRRSRTWGTWSIEIQAPAGSGLLVLRPPRIDGADDLLRRVLYSIGDCWRVAAGITDLLAPYCSIPHRRYTKHRRS